MIRLDIENDEPISGINIIPFTDILLVILVIFMVTTPFLIQSALNISLPNAKSDGLLSQSASKIRIDITADSRIYVDNSEVADLDNFDTLLLSLDAPKKTIALYADKNVPYGTVAKILGMTRMSGTLSIEMVVEKGKK